MPAAADPSSDVVIAVLQERLTQHGQAQQQIVSRLDLIVAKIDGLPSTYPTRTELTAITTDAAAARREITRRVDTLDARIDALKLWLIGALATAGTGLLLEALQHVPMPAVR